MVRIACVFLVVLAAGCARAPDPHPEHRTEHRLLHGTWRFGASSIPGYDNLPRHRRFFGLSLDDRLAFDREGGFLTHGAGVDGAGTWRLIGRELRLRGWAPSREFRYPTNATWRIRSLSRSRMEVELPEGGTLVWKKAG